MTDRTASRSTFCRALVLGAILPLLLTSCEQESGAAADHLAAAQPPDSIAVRVTPILQEPISSLYSTSETLRAEKHAVVIARTAGIIEELMVEEGDTVEADQPLAQLEDDEHRIAADQAHTIFEIRQREYERIQKLQKDGILTETDLSDAKRQADEAQHAADLAQLTLSRTTIRAPFSGTIVERYLDVGATVSNGTPVYELADLDPLHVDVRVPERHIARLAARQKARVMSESLPEPISARIVRISPAVDPETSTVKVTLAIDGAPEALRPGGFVRVEIVTDTVDDAWVVPRSALVAEGRRWQIFRLTADGAHVERLEVERGYEEGERVQIRRVLGESAPLRLGDRIVSLGASALKDGSLVTVAEAEVEPATGEVSWSDAPLELEVDRDKKSDEG